ncbi:hypothetical protein KUV50_17650 [Membranicola marinus]|uniref:Uncharacterized protein n=1 Tax=Membranihabitans marinus TaxID=1227546 RepID=A0A953HXF3_9BACT|nr:hypothetical protein [Membranihabitans marinus]MBY5959980.1 hypothetical protein [Membranihabitans marinus]
MNRFEGKNVLFIYYKFPPIKGIGTLRNAKFYQSFKNVARKVFVATTSNRKFLPIDQFRFDPEDVIEIPTYDFRTIYHFLTGDEGSLIVTQDKTPHKWLPHWKERFKNSFIARHLDEGGSYFVHRGYKLCRKIIEREKIDIIISSYLPFDAHRLAFRLKKRYPHLYWIADYRDFFSDPMLRATPQFSHLQNKHFQFLSIADEVTTVSSGIKKRLSVFHPRVHVVRNGLNHPLTSSRQIPKYKLFTLAYTGSIYPDAQDGTLLARALKELINEGRIKKRHLQFVNAGKDGLYWEKLLESYGIGEILVNHEIIPHKESLLIQQKSHINVLLSWASDDVSGILTGKLFEYLGAEAPIVALINGNFDPELDELISKPNRGTLFQQSETGLKKLKTFLVHQYNFYLNNKKLAMPLYDSNQKPLRGVITWQDEFDNWNKNKTQNNDQTNTRHSLTSNQ